MADKRRQYRVAEKIREIVAQEIIRSEDPGLHLVTINNVIVSNDLRIAKVYWIVSGGERRRREVEEALKRASGYLRSGLAKSLKTRFTPELRFYYDDTFDTLDEVEDLLSKVQQEGSK